MGDTRALVRHDMVELDPRAWSALLSQRPDLAEMPILAGWCARGWPLIHRRGQACDAPGEIALGLPLPPSLGKRRLAFTVPPASVQHAAPPPLLREAAVAAPPAWRATLDRLIARTPHARVFGSLAWQHLTGLPYLSDSSDLDVLWTLPTPDPRCLLDDIAAIAATAPMRIDGEFCWPDGSGASWHELAAEPEILVKRPDGVALMQARDFLAYAA